MAVAYNPKIVTDGLVLALDAANVKSYPGSGTTWTDMSGLSNHGIVNNATYSTLKNGYFSFVNTSITSITNTTPSLVTGNNPFTKSAWLYSNYKGSTNDHPNIISWGTNGTNQKNGLALQTDGSGNPQVLHWFYANDYAWTVSDLTGAWHNIVVTYVSPSLTLYIDGVIQSTITITGTPNVTNNNLEIGTFDGVQLKYSFNGNIPAIHVYNRALSAAEVLQNFNALRGRYGI